jgi:WD40 repeat protein
VGRARDLLKTSIPAPGQKDVRHFEWHYWNRRINGDREVVRLKSGQPELYAEFSPDQRLLAGFVVNGDQVVVRLWDTKTGAVVSDLKGPVLGQPPPSQVGNPDPMSGHFVFSLDGQCLAAVIRTRFYASGKNLDDIRRNWGAQSLWVWDTKSGLELWHKALPANAGVLRPRSFFCFDPMGERIAVQLEGMKDADGLIHVLARQDGKELPSISVPDKAKKDGFGTQLLALSPDWKQMLLSQYPSASKVEPPGAVLLWEVKDDRALWQIECLIARGMVARYVTMSGRIAAFSPDGKRLATHQPSADHTMLTSWVYDAATGKAVRPFEAISVAPNTHFPDFDPRARQYQFSPDGKAILVKTRGWSETGRPIRLFDAATGKLRQELLLPADKVWDVAFSAGGDSVFIAAGNTVQVCSASKPAPFRVNAEPELGLNAAPSSADGRRLAVLSYRLVPIKGRDHKEIRVRVFDTIIGKELLSLGELPAPLIRMRLSADGKRLVAHLGFYPAYGAATTRGELVVWDVDTSKKIGSYQLPTVPALKDKLGGVVHRLETVSADGRLAAFSYQRTEGQRVLKVWELPQGKGATACREICEWVFEGENLPLAHPDQDAAWFSSDGRFLTFVSASIDKRKGSWKWVNHVVDVQTETELWSSDDAGGDFYHSSIAAVSRDGQFLALVEANPLAIDKASKTRDIVVVDQQGQKKFRLMGHREAVASVAFSPDGQRLASFASGPGSSAPAREIKLWDLHNGQEVLTLTTGARRGTLQFSSDGHRLLLCSGGGRQGCELHTWDATPLPGSTGAANENPAPP